jgi:hypothetical protein
MSSQDLSLNPFALIAGSVLKYGIFADFVQWSLQTELGRIAVLTAITIYLDPSNGHLTYTKSFL